ncbi:hypothetical protein AOZ06_46625 [Kibdelosporangium phytohabitans]|uniref:Sulfotransferase domain-containing protein n=2 Tax=Kibdelosporangium phytohabitans TaxID=860235 RepID=A0A0N9IAE8_9PSEU|nr:hypothetical protein AOZ06_46625 [Kibdelosporangium phytohabitans]
MKSGTHLIQELLVAAGYGIYGQSRITDGIRPRFDRAAQARIVETVFDPVTVEKLSGADPATFSEAADEAWRALGWAWQTKFGMPLENRYGREVLDTDLIRETVQRTAAMDFAETPAGVAWILSEVELPRIDGRFLREWFTTGRPHMLFTYRDPRDVVLSMVNFLSGLTRQGYGTFSQFAVFHEILAAKPTLDERLTYALSDPAFPGFAEFQNSQWLLHHPRVCRATFEELIGERGGGSADRQLAAVTRILEFLDVDADPRLIADQLFNDSAFTFYKGRIGAWREVFTARHEALFNERFGHILTDYGYA